MGLFSKLFPKASVNEATGAYFETLNGYQPVFRTFRGGIYEAELCRACVHAFANHVSKLKPVVTGPRKDLGYSLETAPNQWMDTTKFLYKLATVLETETTAFIVPVYDKWYQKIVGYYPVQPKSAVIVEKDGITYVAFTFANGKRTAIEFSEVGIVNKFFYSHDFFGEGNAAMNDTLQLMKTQQQGISEGIKQSAVIRFIGKLAGASKDKTIEEERARWRKYNLSAGNNGGIALVDGKYDSIQQIDSKPYLVDADQIKAIQENVFNYFGCSKEILQNSFSPQQWDAYYEGKVEPFALQLSLVLTNMTFTSEQRVRGNRIQFTANRLQYATPEQKLNIVTQMTDRGMMSRNEGREIFNMEPIAGGDAYVIRGEYVNAADKLEGEGDENGAE